MWFDFNIHITGNQAPSQGDISIICFQSFSYPLPGSKMSNLKKTKLTKSFAVLLMMMLSFMANMWHAFLAILGDCGGRGNILQVSFSTCLVQPIGILTMMATMMLLTMSCFNLAMMRELARMFKLLVLRMWPHFLIPCLTGQRTWS